MPFCQNPSSGDIKVTFLVEGFLFIFSYRYVGGEKLFKKNKLYSLCSPFPKRCIQNIQRTGNVVFKKIKMFKTHDD